MSGAYLSSARGVWRGVDHDDEHEEEDGDPAETGRVEVQRFVLLAPNRWRVTGPADRPLRMCDGERMLIWRAEGEPPVEYAVRTGAWSFTPDPFGLLRPLPTDDWRPGEDYAEPLGAPTPEVVLGRRCWRVDLAPPPHKSGVYSLWVDEETGVRLRTANSLVGVLEEFVELELDVDVDPAEFGYDGPVDRSEQQRRDKDEQALRHFTERPPPVPTFWPRGVGFSVMGGDPDTGASVVALDVARAGALLGRHPRGEPPWTPTWDGGQVHRWTDAQWQWTLVVLGEPLSAAELQAVVASVPASSAD
jgi:hypothetical protein